VNGAPVPFPSVTTVSDRPAVAPEPEPKTLTHDPVWLIALVALCVAAGIVLRFVTTSALWLDEALTVNIATVPLDELRSALEQDGAPPLYYMLLHFWTDWFGTGDVSVRFLSGAFAVAALIPMWFAARRLAGADDPANGRRIAWIAVVVLASNPYAIRYATETRMYSLVIFLVLCGYLAIARAMERPTFTRLALVSFLGAALMYTQYWSMYLLAAVGLWALWRARPGSENARRARLLILGLVGVGVLFLPWVPTFLSQLAHTGTPWGVAVAPPTGMVYALLDFAGGDHTEGWTLFFPSFALLLLAIFGLGVATRTIELDLRTRRAARPAALIAFGTLLIGLGLSFVSGTAFQSRYAAVAFPLYLLLIALGFARFVDARIRIAAVAVVVALGFAGGVRNVVEQRTQAPEVADAINPSISADDLIIYCPDQVGPDVSRLLPDDARGVTFPSGDGPMLIDWVDYADVVNATDPVEFTREVIADVPDDATIWVVWSPGYRHFEGKCEAIISELRSVRPGEELVVPDETLFERQGLVRFPAS